MDLNIKHLEYILEIYRHKSINRAAKACYISQPYLSKIVKDVEEKLGFQIIERDHTGLTFNQNGLYFVEYAEKIIREARNIERIPLMLADNAGMHIISSPSGMIMQAFLDYRRSSGNQEYNDIFKEGGLQEILQQVLMGETPLGIMVMFSKSHDRYIQLADGYGLSLDKIRENIPGQIVMSKDHPLASLTVLKVEDLRNQAFVLDSGLDETDTLIGLLGLNKNNNFIYVSNRASRFDAVRSGSYIYHGSQLTFDAENHPSLCAKEISDFHESLCICSLKQAGRPYSPRESEFLALLKEYF